MAGKPVIAGIALCLFSGWVWSQEPGQVFGRADESGSSQRQQRTTQRRSLFLSGEIVLDDGQTPGEQVRVELVCQGTLVRRDYASSDGTFSMEINSGAQEFTQPMDASVATLSSSPLSGEIAAGPGSGAGPSEEATATPGDSLDLSMCNLQARTTEYESARISLGRRSVLENPDVGVIVLYRMDGWQGGTIGLITLAAPEEAGKAYEKAGKEFSKGKPDLSTVTKELEKAVEIYPEFAAAWFMLGEVRKKLNDRSGASEAFEQAIAADSQHVKPYLGLMMMAIEEEQWERAVQLSDQALKLSPNHIRVHYLNALANGPLGRIDVAEESALRVRESSEAHDYPLIHYVLGWIMSQKGDFPSAAGEYRRLLEIQPTTRLSKKLREQLADWERQGLIRMSQN